MRNLSLNRLMFEFCFYLLPFLSYLSITPNFHVFARFRPSLIPCRKYPPPLLNKQTETKHKQSRHCRLFQNIPTAPATKSLKRHVPPFGCVQMRFSARCFHNVSDALRARFLDLRVYTPRRNVSLKIYLRRFLTSFCRCVGALNYCDAAESKRARFFPNVTDTVRRLTSLS